MGGAHGGAVVAPTVVTLLLLLAAAAAAARRRWPGTAKAWLGGGAGGSGPPVVQAVELHAAVACDMTNEGGDVPLRLADSAKRRQPRRAGASAADGVGARVSVLRNGYKHCC